MGTKEMEIAPELVPLESDDDVDLESLTSDALDSVCHFLGDAIDDRAGRDRLLAQVAEAAAEGAPAAEVALVTEAVWAHYFEV